MSDSLYGGIVTADLSKHQGLYGEGSLSNV